MIELIFYGGVNEIGGNKIFLHDNENRVFFDFGKSFEMGENYFFAWLAPRGLYGLKDYFEFDLLPKIRGLYGKKQLEYTDFPYTDPEIDAIFLLHAHFDHIAHVCFVYDKIPVYYGSCTKLFIKSHEETTSSFFGEHVYETFRTGNKIAFDSLTVEPIHVDHSIPGAYGFIIHTSKGTIVYTGDLRSHGPKKEMTDEFVKKASSCDPIALITEGTRMVKQEHRPNYSESEVREKSNEIVANSDKIVFVTRYGRDIDRFRTLYAVAKENNRMMVVFPRTAYLLSKLVHDEHLDICDPMKEENILVYYKRKRSGTYAEEDYYLWERTFMDKMVTSDYVHKNQNDLLLDLDFYQFGELVNIKPQVGSDFIHSMSEPFSEEDIEDRIMHNWLNHFQLNFHQLHASGHLSGKELTKMVELINPKKLFPVHSETPQLFKKINKNTVLIKKGKPYRL